MKKTIISCIIILIIITAIIISAITWKNNKNDNDLTKVTVAEPTLT